MVNVRSDEELIHASLALFQSSISLLLSVRVSSLKHQSAYVPSSFLRTNYKYEIVRQQHTFQIQTTYVYGRLYHTRANSPEINPLGKFVRIRPSEIYVSFGSQSAIKTASSIGNLCHLSLFLSFFPSKRKLSEQKHTMHEP
jgi:hypothetical protein